MLRDVKELTTIVWTRGRASDSKFKLVDPCYTVNGALHFYKKSYSCNERIPAGSFHKYSRVNNIYNALIRQKYNIWND